MVQLLAREGTDAGLALREAAQQCCKRQSSPSCLGNDHSRHDHRLGPDPAVAVRRIPKKYYRADVSTTWLGPFLPQSEVASCRRRYPADSRSEEHTSEL